MALTNGTVVVAMVTVAAMLFIHVFGEANSSPTERFFTGDFVRGVCEIQGLYPVDRNSFDRSAITRQYSLGEHWTDRCNNCTCTTSGAMCRGPGSNCQHWYDFSLENWCLQ
ncbi:hypothetical protein ElyMa_005191100, partial [Elysia marginata]